MSIIQSKWLPFFRGQPTHATTLQMDMIRRNLQALDVMGAASVAHGWSYTNSVTRGEGTPGTAALPLRQYWYYGTGNSRIWVKAVNTYTGTDKTKIALYYSDDNESTYVAMVDESEAQNYVLTLAYDGANNLEETTWGNIP